MTASPDLAAATTTGHAQELLRTMLEESPSVLVNICEAHDEGMTAGLCTLDALEALQRLERKGWQFIPPDGDHGRPPATENQAEPPGEAHPNTTPGGTAGA